MDTASSSKYGKESHGRDGGGDVKALHRRSNQWHCLWCSMYGLVKNCSLCDWLTTSIRSSFSPQKHGSEVM